MDMASLTAAHLSGLDLGHEVVIRHGSFDQHRHAILRRVEHVDGSVVGTIATKLWFFNSIGGFGGHLVLPGTTRVEVYDAP